MNKLSLNFRLNEFRTLLNQNNKGFGPFILASILYENL